MGGIKISEAPERLRKYFEFADKVVFTECHKQWRAKHPDRTEGMEAGNGYLDTYDEAQVAAREIRKAVNDGKLADADLILFRQIVCQTGFSPAECRQDEELRHLRYKGPCEGLAAAESAITDVRDLIEVEAYRDVICKLSEKRPELSPRQTYSLFYSPDSRDRKAFTAELVDNGSFNALIDDVSALLSTELFNRPYGRSVDRKIWSLISDTRFTNFGWTLNVELYGDHCLPQRAQAATAAVKPASIAKTIVTDKMISDCSEVIKTLSWIDAAILYEHIGRPDHLSEWMVRGNYITGAGELAGTLLTDKIRSALHLEDLIFKKISSEKLLIAPHTEYAHLKALNGLSGIRYDSWKKAPANLIAFLADNMYSSFRLENREYSTKTIGELCKDLLGMIGKRAVPLVRTRLDLNSEGVRKDATIELINDLGIASPNADKDVIVFLVRNIEDFKAQNALRSIGKKALKELTAVTSENGTYRSDIAKELILEINKGDQ